MMILTLAVVNTIVLISNLVSFNPVYHHIQFHNSIHTIYWLWYSEYILDLFYLYKTRQTFLKYLEFYKTIDGLIQVPNFIAMRTTLTRICIWFVLSFILISMFDFMSWRIGSGFWIPPILYSVNYLYNFMNSLTVFDVISQVIQVEYRLQIMVNIIEKHRTICNLNDNLNEQMFVRDVEIGVWIRPAQLRDTRYHKVGEVRSLSKLYLFLSDQVSYINKAFGVRVSATLLVSKVIYQNV